MQVDLFNGTYIAQNSDMCNFSSVLNEWYSKYPMLMLAGPFKDVLDDSSIV